MTDQPEATPLSDEEIDIARRHAACDLMFCLGGRPNECERADAIKAAHHRWPATIDRLQLEGEHSDAMRRARDILAVATDDDVLAALRDTDQTRTELIVAEERCEFLRTQVADLTTAGDQFRAKVAELETALRAERELYCATVCASYTSFENGEHRPRCQQMSAPLREEITRRKGAK